MALTTHGGKVLDVEDFIQADNFGRQIAHQWLSWERDRREKLEEWKEIQKYVFATDTTKTSNSHLPWSNKTTIPKLCQIRDNLFSNYMAALFPKRKSIVWEGNTKEDNDYKKARAISSYMSWVLDRNEFYGEVSKLVYDYIDYGNAFAIVEWMNDTVDTERKIQAGFSGPVIRRISPLDIVFNPTASDFKHTPKIIRSLVSKGEVMKMLMSNSTMRPPEDMEQARAIWDYIKDVRERVGAYQGEVTNKDDIYKVGGFDSFRSYLCSDTVEILTFYGDIYDEETGELKENRCIKIADRHKVIYDEPVQSYFPYGPVYHVGWRLRPDNLWAMGPLDNLVGMQYRIDHLENMKADVFDLIAYPPLKIKGYVEDFEWGPMERIYVGDDGDVELRSPDVQALQADTQIAILENKMEEMAGSPKEAMGFRTPGEKTKYEVQRLENAASRIFESKTAQFERDFFEDILNGMLELAHRNMGPQVIRVFDEDSKVALFRDLTAEDITGQGRVRAYGARNFAEKANMLQNITGFFGSVLGQDPNVSVHFSTERIARMLEDILEVEQYNLVEPYIRLSEQKEAQSIASVNEEDSLMESQTPSGLTPDDADEPFI